MKAVHQIFEDKVLTNPDKVAIENGEDKVTYERLNGHVNKLSRVLTNLGVISDVFVGVLLRPGYHLISALLASFKSNGVYMPMDWSFSAKRFEQIFNNSFSGVLVVEANRIEDTKRLVEEHGVALRHLIVLNEEDTEVYNGGFEKQSENFKTLDNDNPKLEVIPGANNYIYYTSGSTGEGKAIVGNHESLAHFINWEIDAFNIDETVKVSQLAQITFDASLKDIFTALCAGGTLCIPTYEEKNNLSQLVTWLEKSKVTLLQCVPSIFRLITDELLDRDKGIALTSLKQVVLAGEMLYAKDLINWQRAVGGHVAVANLYGTTESTILKTCNKITEIPANPAQAIHVGKPISDTQVAVINDGHICRTGEKGEVYIKTKYLSNGYYKNKKLNNQTFIQNPLTDKEDIVYKTGDIGRYLKSGDIEILGRADNQVKINGVRVELGEVEGAMLSLNGIDKAVVMAISNEKGHTELVAYHINNDISTDQIRNKLKDLLNPELIPSYFICLDEFPLNINGKVDRKSLPKPKALELSLEDIERPKGTFEERLANIWKKVLELDVVGRNQSFFELGGNSLKALRITSLVYKEFQINLKLTKVFTAPTIKELAKAIEIENPSTYLELNSIEEQEYYSLSYGQQRIWALLQLESDEGAYNMHSAFEIDGAFDHDIFDEAFRLLLSKHESLRTYFISVNGEPKQKVFDDIDDCVHFKTHDLSDCTDAEEKLEQIAVENARYSFSLENYPLFKLEFAKTPDSKTVVFLTIHHIIADGWSTEIMSADLASFYQALKQRKSQSINKQRIQYKDYVAWQHQLLSDDTLSYHKQYWLKQFEGEIPVLNLPTDRPRPAIKTYKGARVAFDLDPDLSRSVASFCKQNTLSQYEFFLAVFNQLFYFYTGQTDIVIGSPSAGRNHPDLEDQIGFYLNNIPIRTNFDSKDTFKQLVENVKSAVHGAQDHNVYPFHLLVKDLGIKRDLSRSPLYDVGFTWHELAGSGEMNGVDFGMKRYNTPFVTAKGDLWFHGMNKSDVTGFFIEYNTDLFDEAWPERFSEHFKNLLGSLLDNPEKQVADHLYLSDKEIAEQLNDFKSTNACEVASTLNVFDEVVRKYAESKAVSFGDSYITYKQLDEKSDALASYLVSEWGIGKDDVVAIIAHRSIDTVVCLLGILKAGAAFLPIEPNTPKQRIAYILDDAKVSGVITESELLFELSNTEEYKLFALDVQLQDLSSEGRDLVPPSGTDLAYVIYTSGSTGNPKGVAIQHDSLANYLQWANKYYFEGKNGYSFGWLTPLSFDLTLTSIFTTITRGDNLVVLGHGENDELLQSAFSKQSEIKALKLTPSHLGILEHLPVENTNVELVIVGGEKLKSEHTQQLFKLNPEIKLFNEYGPTETTIGCTVQKVQPNKITDSVGRPIDNTSVYILDEHFNFLPLGSSGEICIAGTGVAKGYLNNEQLTEESFIKKPFEGVSKLYRTGDKGKWSVNGELIYQGRVDEQIKIRGYRVEPGEIESCIAQNESIEKAAVLLNERKQLVAFYVATDDISIGKHLDQFLPKYMIPDLFVRVKDFPVTANGKLDKQKLISTLSKDISKESAQAENDLQRTLLDIWKNVLNRKDLGIKDDFFEVGGESLKAIQLVYNIQKELEVKVKPSDVFQYPTIEKLSDLISNAQHEKQESLLVYQIEEQEHYPVSHSQKRLWYFDQMNKENKDAYQIPTIHRFQGDLDLPKFPTALKLIIERHESLRTSFVTIDDEPRQKVLPIDQVDVNVSMRDISRHDDKDISLEQIKKEFDAQPFNLSKAPLLKTLIVKYSDGDYFLLCTVHHIVSDEWSFELFAKELMQTYTNLLNGLANNLEALPVQYKEFTLWQNQVVDGHEVNEHKAYWLDKFNTVPPVIDLPFSKPRPEVKTFLGERVNFNLDKDLVDQLRGYCDKSGTSLFMLLMATLKVLIYRYTRESDVVLCTPTVGRDHSDLETQIGNFINLLPIRESVNGEEKFETFLGRVKQSMLGAYDHQVYPFDCLLEELNIESDLSRQPLFDLGFTWHNHKMTGKQEVETPDLNVQQHGSGFVKAKADLWFHGMDAGDVVGLSAIFSKDLFDKKDIVDFVNHYQTLLGSIIKSEVPINELSYIPEDKVHSLIKLGQNPREYDQLPFVVDLFEERVKANPDATALTIADRNYTYYELDQKVNQLANVLIEKYNIQPGDTVGVVVHRSEWIVISLLAIFKVGGVYLPCDPDNPSDRIAYILQNAGMKALISQSELLIELMEYFTSSLVMVDMELSNEDGNCMKPDVRVSKEDPAYIIYTSGTSGNPKGVKVTHGSLMNLLKALRDTFGYHGAKHFALLASISFDSSLKQILQPLMLGRHLVILDNIRDVKKLAKAICEYSINVVTITPTVLQAVVFEMSQNKLSNNLNYIFCGGEILSTAFCNQLLDYFPNTNLVNIYGPTETTDLAAVYEIDSKQDSIVPIGRPLFNCEVYILDESQQLLPQGVKGEIHIGGRGVSMGYIFDEARSKEKFVAHPFKPGERIYKSGDMGFYDSEGNLKIVGRVDNQVKVRGHRIELGEIENKLMNYPYVKHCGVTSYGEGGDKELVAYVVEKEMITIKPSWAEQYVYDDMAYYAMSNDHFRNSKYEEALTKKVKDKVVLEIGPGAEAILSIMSVECGAKKVYAVEILEEAYKKAKSRVASLGLENKIEVIHGNVIDVELPEKVDFCVSEIFGAIGGSQGAAKILNASGKHIKDSAAMIPAKTVSNIAAVTLPPEEFDYAFDEVGAHYAEKIFERVGYKFDLRLSLDNIQPSNLISSFDVFEELDYRKENAIENEHNIELEVNKDSIINGFIVWLDLWLDDEVNIDTLFNKEQQLWLPIYLPVFSEGVNVKAGDKIKATVTRKISKNGLQPDYFIKGELVGQNNALPFTYSSYNEEKVLEGSPFYSKLFDTSYLNGYKQSESGLKVYKGIDQTAVVNFLSTHLPHYMLPSYVIKVDNMPTTVNGKIDFNSLPKPDELEISKTSTPSSQMDIVEEKLMSIWQEVLKRDAISLDDSFFSIGGHSLRAAQMISRIHKEFNVDFDLKDVFDNPTVQEMAEAIRQINPELNDEIDIAPIEEQDHYSVSHAQKRLWLLQQSNLKMTAYNNPITLEINDTFDKSAFQEAFRQLIERHDVLRTSFVTVGGVPRQTVVPVEIFKSEVEYHETSDEKEISKLINRFSNTPFDLENDPLVKTMVVKVGDEKFVWCFSMHHIISDAWSLGVIMDELMSTYQSYLASEKLSLAPLKIQYKDYTAWQNNLIANRSDHKKYWLEQFDEVPALQLPFDYDRSEESLDGDQVIVSLEDNVSQKLSEYASALGTSKFVFLLTSVGALLQKYTGQGDIVLGTNVAGRDHQDLEDQIGFYLNTIPLRLKFDEEKQFRASLESAREIVLNAFEHQAYPYDLIVSNLNEAGVTDGSLLFNVEVELINANMNNSETSNGKNGLKAKSYDNGFSVSKDDLSFRFVEDNNQMLLNINYKTSLFERDTIERMAKHYKQLLASILLDIDKPLSDLDYLSEEEREQLTSTFNMLD